VNRAQCEWSARTGRRKEREMDDVIAVGVFVLLSGAMVWLASAIDKVVGRK